MLTRRSATASRRSKGREYSWRTFWLTSSEVCPGTSSCIGGVAARLVRRPLRRQCIWLATRCWTKEEAWFPFGGGVNLLDENIPLDQCDLLRARGVRCRIVG